MRRIEGTTLGGYRCDHVACDANGIAAVSVIVPAQGLALDRHNPLQIIFDVHVCRQHAGVVKRDGVGRYLSPAVIERCKDHFGLAEVDGKRLHLKPDFDRAFLQSLATNSPRFLEFQQTMGLVPPDDAMVKGPAIEAAPLGG